MPESSSSIVYSPASGPSCRADLVGLDGSVWSSCESSSQSRGTTRDDSSGGGGGGGAGYTARSQRRCSLVLSQVAEATRNAWNALKSHRRSSAVRGKGLPGITCWASSSACSTSGVNRGSSMKVGSSIQKSGYALPAPSFSSHSWNRTRYPSSFGQASIPARPRCRSSSAPSTWAPPGGVRSATKASAVVPSTSQTPGVWLSSATTEATGTNKDPSAAAVTPAKSS
mmetsp:Transcript_42897/g.103343  ORF Transcript_42897/g.103343 Transcript_42897/m.103343 type:complete len:226 (+) Transcript_42897:374-1051(+)